MLLSSYSVLKMHVETASFYVTEESGGSMCRVNTMVITFNICMAMRTLNETDNSGINSDALLLVVMVLS